MLLSTQEMGRESSITMTPPDPAIDPQAAMVSKSIGTSSRPISTCWSPRLTLNTSPALNTLADDPPGITALSLRPGRRPPHRSWITSPSVILPTSTSK